MHAKGKVLVIEDNPELLVLNAMILGEEGYEVQGASSGREGLKIVRDFHPDVVLLDVVLPDISGIEVCRNIKNHSALKDILVVLMSGIQISSDLQADGLNMGADGFIRKPIPNKELIARVQSMVRIRRAEEALRASETRYRRLFEAARDGILILHEETGQIEDINPFLTDMLGYTREELIGRKLWEIGPFKDTEASKAVHAELQQKGYVRYEDLPLVTRDGKEIEVEFVSNVYLVNDHKVIQCNIRDITTRRIAEKDLQRSQKLFHTIARVSPVGLFIASSDGRFEYINECWSEITGLSIGEVLGEEWVRALNPADMNNVLDRWRKTVQLDLPFEEELSFHQPDGTEKWIEVRAIAERGLYAERLRYVGTFNDITERKYFERKLQKAYDELEIRVVERTGQLVVSNTLLEQEIDNRRIVEEKLKESQERLRHLTKHLQQIREQERAFLARELHDEFGQILTGLKMDIRWIQRRLSDDIAAATERLNSMLMIIDKAIILVQRISMSLRPPVLDDFGIDEVIELVLRDFRNRTNIQYEFIHSLYHTSLGTEMSTEIFRILQEALTNIVRHAKAKSVTVVLKSTGESLCLEIRDDGRGIKKSEISKPSSIGLTGMRERVYALEGSIEIHGVRGKGTTISMSIPLREKKTKKSKKGKPKDKGGG